LLPGQVVVYCQGYNLPTPAPGDELTSFKDGIALAIGVDLDCARIRVAQHIIKGKSSNRKARLKPQLCVIPNESGRNPPLPILWVTEFWNLTNNQLRDLALFYGTTLPPGTARQICLDTVGRLLGIGPEFWAETRYLEFCRSEIVATLTSGSGKPFEVIHLSDGTMPPLVPASIRTIHAFTRDEVLELLGGYGITTPRSTSLPDMRQEMVDYMTVHRPQCWRERERYVVFASFERTLCHGMRHHFPKKEQNFEL
jgi:hypothetical protein